VFALNQDLGPVGGHPTAPFFLSIGQIREPAASYLGGAVAAAVEELLAVVEGDGRGVPRRLPGVGRAIGQARRPGSSATRTRAGGKDYAARCALAFRQAYGATELVSRNGEPWRS